MDKAHKAKPQNVHTASKLHEYKKLLANVTPDHPLILAEDGENKYAVLDIASFEEYKTKSALDQINQFVDHAMKEPTSSYEDVKKELMNEDL